jgi:hypothetical protein
MDPYLERQGFGEEVHTRLIVAIADELGQQVRPHYRVNVERRTYLSITTPDAIEFVGKPDVLVTAPPRQASGATVAISHTGATPHVAALPMPEEVVERYLEVREVMTGEVITIIELLSPSNKLKAEGRQQYERKRLAILGSATNLIEIDLLRAGQPFPFWLQDDADTQSDYRIVVSRALQRPRADVYLFSMREPIPDIPVPLKPGEVEAVLPLNQILHTLYDRASYDLVIDYQQQPPLPSLDIEDMEWVGQVAQRHRSGE